MTSYPGSRRTEASRDLAEVATMRMAVSKRHSVTTETDERVGVIVVLNTYHAVIIKK
jgi:hypothetical protein